MAVTEKDLDLELMQRELASRELRHYVPYIYEATTGKKFRRGWHQELISEALTEILERRLKRLIITMPPSYGKTEYAVRGLTSFGLGKYPNMSFGYVTYGDDLTKKVSVQTRNYVKSKAYGNLFPNVKLALDQNEKTFWTTTAGGGLYGSTVTGAITGSHFDCLILDDLLKAIDKSSDAKRKEVIDFYTSSAESRLEDFVGEEKPMLVIMQRLAKDDLVGYLLKEEGHIWTHIDLKVEEDSRKTYCIGGFSYEREAFEPLFPAKHDRTAIERLKLKGADFQIMYMQNPEVPDGGYLEEEQLRDINDFEIVRDTEFILVDPAMSSSEKADDRGIVAENWWMDEDSIERVVMMDAWRGNWDLDEFVDNIINAMILYPQSTVVIMKLGGGEWTHQTLLKKLAQVNTARRQKGENLISNDIVYYTEPTTMSKADRIIKALPYAKSGQVYIRKNANCKDEFIKQWKAFDPAKIKNQKNDLLDPFCNGWMLTKDLTAVKPKKQSNEVSPAKPSWRI
ncbi:MAG TPA: hypothetical protein PKW30_04300 [Campylobacterales bacterium]|nr:hypothetical protein [Campylobacterales bacterium]